MAISELIQRHFTRRSDHEYLDAIDEVVRRQRELLGKGLSVKESLAVLGDVQAQLSEKYRYGIGDVAEDTVAAGLRVRD